MQGTSGFERSPEEPDGYLNTSKHHKPKIGHAKMAKVQNSKSSLNGKF